MNEIWHGDCFGLFDRIPSESVALVLADPPYFISTEMKISRGSQGKFTGCDISGDFGEWDHFNSLEDYYDFTSQWIDLCVDKIMPGGYFIVWFDKRKSSFVFDVLEDHGFRTRDLLVWIKSNPVPQVRKVKFAQGTEVAVVCSKPGPNRFQWQRGYHPNWKKAPIVGGKERLKDEYGRTLHPTQKPLSMFRWLIDYHTEHGDVVLDPFCGTGTTAEAAVASGRDFICMEAEDRYSCAAMQRAELAQSRMLGFYPYIDYKSEKYKKESW